MQPTQARLGGANIKLGTNSHFLGWWGHINNMRQKGIVTYGVAPNRQNPLAGAMHDAIFNVWRRFSSQVLYWAPPMVVGYYTMQWAIHRNHYLNSKAGRAEFSDSE